LKGKKTIGNVRMEKRRSLTIDLLGGGLDVKLLPSKAVRPQIKHLGRGAMGGSS